MKKRYPPKKPEHNWEKHYQLKEGDVFLEAGACVGRYAYIASENVGATGKVILIEPFRPNLNRLYKLIKRNSMDNCIVLEKAVWSEKARMGFSTNRHPLSNRIDSTSEEIIEVDTIDNIIDDLHLPEINLLGADVEGAEAEMLIGAHKSLSNKVIKNVAIGAYHFRNKYLKQVMTLLNEHSYNNIIHEDSVVYARANHLY